MPPPRRLPVERREQESPRVVSRGKQIAGYAMTTFMRWEPVEDLGDGSIVAAIYGGRIAGGSSGNILARQFVEHLQNVVATAEPAGVVIDLTELDYTYGDAIGGLALPFLNRIREGRRIMPVGIVATGPTAT